MVTLLLVTSVLGLIAVFGPHSNPAEQAERLTSLAPSEVTQIRLERAARDPVALRRDNGGWQLVAPITGRANPIRAAALASLAGGSSNIAYPTSEVDVEGLGLGAEALVLRLNDVELRIGGREEVRGLRYVQNGARVFLVQDRFYHHVSATTPGFVDPALFDPKDSIIAIRAPEFDVESGESGLTWHPPTAFASADDAATWLATWRNLSALTVSFADYSVSWQPAVTVQFASGASERLVFRTQQGRVWVARPDHDLQYELPATRAKALGLVAP